MDRGRKIASALADALPDDYPAAADILVRSLGPRAFRLGEADVGAGESVVLKERVSLEQPTTRTHYPRIHTTEVLVNGVPQAGPTFDVQSTVSGRRSAARSRRRDVSRSPGS